MTDMANGKSKIKEKIFSNVKRTFGERFNIEEKPYSKSYPNIILFDKTYGDAIFDMFILEPDDDILNKLDDWKDYINKNPEKHYIIAPQEKADDVKKFSKLISEHISVAVYVINDSGRVEGIVYG